INYSGVGPRYEGRHARPDPDPVLRVVTFNVKWGRAVDRLVELLAETPSLRDADLVFLQEMSAPGVEQVARALGYDYVYYPAVHHPVAGQDFGNAILTRWTIVEDRKIVLPERHRFRDMQRIAVAATVDVDGTPVRAYCVHLETPAGIEGPQRRHQVEAVLADAAPYERVLVAGDFNNRNQVGALFEKAGYTWLTENVRRTISLWTWDHIFARGLALRAPGRVGTVRETRGVSDHRPVWAELALDQSARAPGPEAARPASAVRKP
ncbi:MAG TPA: endonuclease/exonuclease/phosphatase family protein, partial [Vicinamibacteria bacterium]|nr:endonuclease/exonuclease/phosphatase family protein [Vicinamibacteria bacterium]